METRPSYTFEIFPPKYNQSKASTYAAIDGLAALNPDLISVTYGAGGSSRDNTIEISSAIQNKYKIQGVAHLTCVDSSRENILKILDELKANNIKNILALRGDLKDPNDLSKCDFHYAAELIKFINQERPDDFKILAAGYPDKHPEAASLEQDLKNLKAKCDLGVSEIITQLFFDNDEFFKWLDKVRALGINQPVVAGIMPVTSASQLERMASMCGAVIPERVKRFVEAYKNNSWALKDAGVTYASEQILDLLARGVDGIHLYTMNQVDITRRIDENIRSALYCKRFK
ncbi:MAG: methylenetetrahydrofolate reductase [Synergistaceae bacterium]|nr:methylenetetrahydrofolate reductase [NAD(P)H] [Synergistaceae bacterium]